MSLKHALVAIMSTMLSLFLIFATSILVMINGWGLEPKSWGWIFSGYAVTGTVSLLSQAITKCLTGGDNA